MSNQLKRRTILRGLGTTMALPMLEAMLPQRSAFAMTAPKQPNRAAFVFFANGVIEDNWKPEGGAGPLQMTPTLQPLAKHKNKINLFSGLTQHHARANGDGAGDHARSASAFLTGAQPRKTSGADIKVGQSIDQAIAERIGDQTRLPSIELGVVRGRSAGSCDSGYSCAYSNSISWKTENTPAPKEINPKLAFERLFGSKDKSGNEKKRNANRKSILDLVAGDAASLKKKLGQTDRRKIDEYFNSVREVEQRIDRAEKQLIEIPDYEVPDGVPGEFPLHARIMFDIMTLAFQTDCTRVATFMLGNAGSNRSYPDVNVKEGHHAISHHRNDKGKVAKLSRIDKFLVQQFAYFLDKLDSVQDGNGTLLDNSMVLYGSAISDGNRHQHHDLPILLAGGGGGTISTGRHMVFPKETPLNDLFLSMADRVGAKLDHIGDSKGRLKI
ncbi:MAG: DUF1552 domain-containing protein [Planctomycetaceae bacterium]